MTTDDLIRELELAIQSQTDAELEAIRLIKEAKTQVKIATIRLKFGASSPSAKPIRKLEEQKPRESKPKTNNAIEKFIAENPDMEPETIEFLRRVESVPNEVIDFIDEIGQKVVGPRAITERVSEGIYDPGPSNSAGKRIICNLSVVKRHLFPHLCPPLTDKKTAPGRSSSTAKGKDAR